MSKTNNKEKIETIVSNYLLSKSEDSLIKFINDNHFVVEDRCFRLFLQETFDCDISCKLYDQVVNGEGNEKDKIRAVYSSSLQSLLFFSGVGPDNKILIDGISYDEVYFEYKNKVIGYPSSVDVVLVDSKGKNVLFIESKLLEIIRDSDKEGKKVVGKSYFDIKKECGYQNALHLTETPIKNMGIVKENIGYSRIKPITCDGNESENEYVYSYGIKQLLAHIIGIQSFVKDMNKNDARCSNYLCDYKSANVRFMELHNGFPGIDGYDEVIKPQTDFDNHIQEVKKIIKDANKNSNENPFLKEADERISVKTYQELFEGRGEYKISQKIVDFYHLDEEVDR